MKKISAFVLSLTMATSAFAGGPVIVPSEGEPVVVIAGPTSSFNAGLIIPLLLLVLLAVAASNTGNEVQP